MLGEEGKYMSSLSAALFQFLLWLEYKVPFVREVS
jgi:hypothetical protein